MLLVSDEPHNFEHTAQHIEWRATIKEKIHMIEKNHTRVLADIQRHKDTISMKWVYKINKLSMVHFKNTSQGQLQKDTHNNSELIRMKLLHMFRDREQSKQFLLLMHNINRLFNNNLKSVFLNGFLKEEIYMKQPPGFILKGMEEKVLQLKKTLYDLKKASRAWYNEIDKYVYQHGFKKSLNEGTLYIKVKRSDILILSLYVDDLIIT